MDFSTPQGERIGTACVAILQCSSVFFTVFLFAAAFTSSPGGLFVGFLLLCWLAILGSVYPALQYLEFLRVKVRILRPQLTH